MNPDSAQPPSSTAWDFVHGQLPDAEAEAFTDTLETDPQAVQALVEASETLLHLRALADPELAEMWAGAGSPELSADELGAFDHDPDARLDAALAQTDARSRSWAHFRRWSGSPARWGLGLVLAAALVLLMVRVPSEPVPDYSAAWRNGAAATRVETGMKGRYLVGNVADLVLHPQGDAAPQNPEVRVFVGANGGALVPAVAETQVGQSRAVRVLLEITPELGVGTHRVVVLVGSDLEDADPETDLDSWARIETELSVVESL